MKSAVSTGNQASLATRSGKFEWDTYAVRVTALIVATCAVVWAFFCDHPQEFDDIGLFNAPYMYAHYGAVTYPAHGQFHSLVIHPPIHYFLLGLLMKVGLSPFYAEAVPPLFMILLGIYLICFSRFPNPIKAGLYLGFCVPLFLSFVPTMRPDVHRGLALFTGLIALESGRLQNWSTRRLFLGSFLLTYASALHYPGFSAFLGVLVYLIWILRIRSELNWRKPTFALIAGGCVIGLPYLMLFVVPHFHEILADVASTEPFGGVAASVRIHLQVYSSLLKNGGMSTALAPRTLFLPLAIGIPLIFLSTPALLALRATRGMALASLPYPLFLLLLMNHKLYWPGYFLPEFMLYVGSVGALLASALYFLCNRLVPGRWSALAWGLLCITGLATLLNTSPSLRAAEISLDLRVHEAEIARSAGRMIIGPNALVGSRNAVMFYASGAKYYYDVSPDVLWTLNPPLDLNGYFKPFDAIVEHQAFSGLTENTQGKSLVSWYADGILNLRGFYLSFDNPALRYLVLNTKPANQIQGFALLNKGQLDHFQELRDGEYEFVSAVCDQALTLVNPTAPKPLFTSAFLLPPESGGLPQKALVTWLTKRKDYIASGRAILTNCRVRDEVSLGMEQVDVHQMVATLRKTDQTIQFPEHLDDALEARYGPPLEFKVTADGWVDVINFRRGEHSGESYSFSKGESHEFFRSDMNSTDGWQVNRYGQRGGLTLLPDGFRKGDETGKYSSGSSRDHLSSIFVNEPLQSGIVFFSVWAKPLANSELPQVALQNANYTLIGQARPVVTLPDGWVLLAGWKEATKREQVRLVVVQKPETTSLLDKALIVESGNHSLNQLVQP
jgi:hypothetical protein